MKFPTRKKLSIGTKELIDKFESYFANGVKSCWLLTPFLHQIILFLTLEKVVFIIIKE